MLEIVSMVQIDGKFHAQAFGDGIGMDKMDETLLIRLEFAILL